MKRCGVGLLLLVVVGCHPESDVVRPIIPSIEVMKPDLIPQPKATLRLGGTDYRVDLKVTRTGQEQRIALVSGGQEFEHEAYVVVPEAFQLKETADERFVPAIDLLKFPLTVGNMWGWRGNMVSGDISRVATAQIATETAPTYTSTGGKEAVHVTVELEFDTGNPTKPGKRRLQFWFEQGGGIIRREFGAASVRESAP